MYQLTGFKVSNFNEARFKSKDVWIREGECCRVAFPSNSPVWSSSPSITVNEEGEIGIIEQELSVEPLNMDRFDVFFSCHEIQ